MNGRHARKLRKLSEFNPNAKRHYHQFDNRKHYIFVDGEVKQSPGTVVEVTKDGEANTTRAVYKYMKEQWYGRAI